MFYSVGEEPLNKLWHRDFKTHTLNQRRKILDDMHSQLKKYVNRMPAALVSIPWWFSACGNPLIIPVVHNSSSGGCKDLPPEQHRL